MDGCRRAGEPRAGQTSQTCQGAFRQVRFSVGRRSTRLGTGAPRSRKKFRIRERRWDELQPTTTNDEIPIPQQQHRSQIPVFFPIVAVHIHTHDTFLVKETS
jgi:hypothetical protein